MFTFGSLQSLQDVLPFFNADAFQIGFLMVLMSFCATYGISLMVRLLKRV